MSPRSRLRPREVTVVVLLFLFAAVFLVLRSTTSGIPPNPAPQLKTGQSPAGMHLQQTHTEQNPTTQLPSSPSPTTEAARDPSSLPDSLSVYPSEDDDSDVASDDDSDDDGSDDEHEEDERTLAPVSEITPHSSGKAMVGSDGPFLNPVWRTEQTQNSELLFESRRLRLERHEIITDTGIRIPDWLWVDTPDIVNIIPRTPDGDIWVFRERKYALKQRSLGTVGGHISPGDTPLETAKRELEEELQMVAGKWRFLGSFRTDANRGAGISYLYLADDCVFVNASQTAEREKAGRLAALEPNNPPEPKQSNGESSAPVTAIREAPPDDASDPYGVDLEHLQPVLLTQMQFLERLLDNSFLEMKWTGAAALAMLRIQADQLAALGIVKDIPDIPEGGREGLDRPRWD